MGLSPEEAEADRKLRLFLFPTERLAACAILRRVGVTDDDYLITLQAHGSWQTKRWKHASEFARQVLALGTRTGKPVKVLLLGSHTLIPRDTFASIPGVIDLRYKTPVRVAFALAGLSDAYVGHDSGLTLAAIALGTPTVALVGSHNPKWLLGDAEATNVSLLRKRTPAMCRAEHGTCCRSEGRYGDHCPLRTNQKTGDTRPGADCLDEITPRDVRAELRRFPRWKTRRLEERHFS